MYSFNRTHQPFKLHISPCLRRLGQIHYPFSYHLISWFVVRSAPPVTLRLLALPFGAWAIILSTTLTSMLPHPVLSDKDALRHWAGLPNDPFNWRRYVDFPSFPHLTMLTLRNRLGEPYLSQGLGPLKSLLVSSTLPILCLHSVIWQSTIKRCLLSRTTC
jgi:hypothetical protein